ncbi:MAG: serine/threonine-protein kinase [Pseudonocardia sp.]
MNALSAGQCIADRYQLNRCIAVGGMGEVWEATDTRLDRMVAVKVLRPELSDDEDFLHRFRIEARTVASLDHPGIAAVHDYGEDDGPVGGGRTAYLVMELVRGAPLSTLVARGPIPAAETLRIVEQTARALQAAHDRGFVHRDVKPGNILIRSDGEVKLTDFGISKAANAVPVTRSGMVMGTAHYIAPEQASGAEAGPAGDVYSLGIVGYECLTGYRPFRADSALAVAMMQVSDEPPPLPGTVPSLVRQLIETVLDKDPTRRYATGGEFAEAVSAVRRGEAVPAPSGVPEQSRSVPVEDLPGTPSAEPDTAPGATVEPIAAPEPTPTAGPTVVGVRTTPPVPQPRPRPVRHDPIPQRVSSIEPLLIQPRALPGRTLMLILFVLLTVAAVVVGFFVVRGIVGGDTAGPLAAASFDAGRQPDQPTSRAPRGTVASWEDTRAKPAERSDGVRSTRPIGPPALAPPVRHPIGRRGPA